MGERLRRDSGLWNRRLRSGGSSILNGMTEDQVTVKLLGGDLLIEWDQEADRVYMTGPATVVYDGEIAI